MASQQLERPGAGWYDGGSQVTSQANPRRRKRIWLWVVLAIAFAVAAGLVGLAVLGVIASGPSPDRTKDHTMELSTGESRILAAQLVEVPGYTYQDVSEAESKQIRSVLREQAQALGVPEDFFSAVSLHAVKADDSSQNTALGSLGPEVGFLSLIEFSEAPPAGAMDRLMAGYEDSIDEFEVDGVTVRVFETPDSADSRFTYMWFRHGVQGMFDGAARDETQRWVTDYLSQPVRVGAESGLLGAAAVPVPGYDYTNIDVSGDDVTTYVTDPFGDASFSAHRITDRNEELGDLLLVEPARAMTTAEVASALGDSIGSRRGDLTPVGTSEHSGVEVEHMRSSDADLYVWSDHGIVGLFMTSDHPTDAEPFVDAYLAQRAGTA